MGSGFSLKYKPEVTPDNNKTSAFDPNYGFPNGRKERGNQTLFEKLNMN